MSGADDLWTDTTSFHADLRQHYEEKNSSLLAYFKEAA